MTDDSIEAKALALVNEVEREEGEKELTRRIMRGLIMDQALCRAIEQHEAYKQRVSQTASSALVMYHRVGEGDCMTAQALQSLIIPAPKPDPLVEVLGDLEWYNNSPECAAELRAALDARGLEIRSKNDA
jgi:hypothetical protein